MACAFACVVSTGATPRRVANDVEIVGLDYAFKAPSELGSGLTSLRFRNAGKHPHELNVVQLKRGISLEEFIAAANADKPLTPMIERVVGVLFAEPGGVSPSALTVNLVAGATYVVQCIFKDSSKAPSHRELGMFTSIGVSKTARARGDERPRVPVDTITGVDYAFTFPHTLAPGRHRFVFVNAGKHRHEVGLSRIKSGASLQQLAVLEAKGGDIDALLDQNLGVLHSRAGESTSGMLDFDMVAGHEYLLECGFSDTDTSPPHFKLGMFGTIRVTP